MSPVKPYDLLWRLENARGRKAPPSTIYRGLSVLIAAGLVHRITTTGAYVVCRRPGRPHDPAFFICDRCGAAFEHDASEAKRRIERKIGEKRFMVRSLGIVLRGTCSSCR